MKRLLLGVVGMALIAAAFAPNVSAKPTTVKGELIDTACGKTDKETGDALVKCATACAGRGEPVAVYTADGGVYLVTGDWTKEKNKKLISFMGRKVEVTGEVTKAKDGKMTIAAENVTLSK